MSIPTQTREELDALAAEYFCSGRAFEVEYFSCSCLKWERCTYPDFDPTFAWRRKPTAPTKRIVELGPEDFPPGSAVRHPVWGGDWALVTNRHKNAIETNNSFIAYLDLKEQGYELTTNGGRTWRPCQKEIEA